MWRMRRAIYIFSSLKPLTSTLPVPFFCHSSSVCLWSFLNRPPGMTIFPALAFVSQSFFAIRPARVLRSPSRFRCRRVGERSSCGGGGGGGDNISSSISSSSEEEIDDSELIEDGEPGADSVSGGVSISASSNSVASANFESGGRVALLTRFAADCELSEEADDSSKVRFGDRYVRDGEVEGRGYGMTS